MNIPISYRIVESVDTRDVMEWVIGNHIYNRMTYDWIMQVATFDLQEDATAFSLRFKVQKYKTITDKLLNSNDEECCGN